MYADLCKNILHKIGMYILHFINKKCLAPTIPLLNDLGKRVELFMTDFSFVVLFFSTTISSEKVVDAWENLFPGSRCYFGHLQEGKIGWKKRK